MQWDALTCVLVQGGISRAAAQTISKLLEVNRVGGLGSDDVAAAVLKSGNRRILSILHGLQAQTLRQIQSFTNEPSRWDTKLPPPEEEPPTETNS